MKKVSIKHIAKKSGLETDYLTNLFVQKWLISSPKSKKVEKKKAKHLIREMQGITKHWFSKMWFLESFGSPRIAYFLLWLLALWGLFGWLFRGYQQWQVASSTPVDYTVQSLAPGMLQDRLDIDALVEHWSASLPDTGADIGL